MLIVFFRTQIAQLTQSGSALICVILHTQGTNKPMDQQLLIVALEGLSACIAVLRHLGERVRPSLSSQSSSADPHSPATSRNKRRQRPRRIRSSLRRLARQFSLPSPYRRQRRRHRLGRPHAPRPPASSLDAKGSPSSSRHGRSFDAGLDAPGCVWWERGRVVPPSTEVWSHGFRDVVLERSESGVVDSGFQHAGHARRGERGGG